MASAFGVYVHVPFCSSRCGYCDFNTYVPEGGDQVAAYVDAAAREIALMRERVGGRRVDTAFFGGGTPTLLRPAQLNRLLAAIGPADGAEVTVEANPETVSAQSLAELRAGGFTRISLGMQSAAGHVLRVLDRVHTPGRAVAAAREAHAAGFEHVSLDLIYGTPGESDADWTASLEAALSAGTDHLALYSLMVEPGTALDAAVRRGALPAPDDEAQARRYLLADELLGARGFDWYELCAWATAPDAVCRHNLGYWRSDDWWGVGPGAHSHLDGVRWWNVKRPATYAARLSAGESPAAGHETLTPHDRAVETVMLRLRTREGLPRDAVGDQAAVERELGRGRLEPAGDRLVLTREGRLFADAVMRELIPGESP